MKSLWNDNEAAAFRQNDLALRAYTSRLLGAEDSLVLHGGGNTSVKSAVSNLFGEQETILFVKGSGWDLRTIQPAGFSPSKLAVLQRLSTLSSMTDTDMMRELRASMIDPASPTPSVEAILHAIIPCKYVDHTHADAVVAISNTPNGEAHLREIYDDSVMILPYVMPGFVLARQIADATANVDWSALKGIILLHHGVFTFHDDARTSYENMLSIVDRAESFLASRGALAAVREQSSPVPDIASAVQLSAIRRRVAAHRGRPVLAHWDRRSVATGYASRADVDQIATRGPITPDHTIHTKCTPVMLNEDPVAEIDRFAEHYRAYFAAHGHAGLTCLDPAARVGIWKNRGILSFGTSWRNCMILRDIAEHTAVAVQWGEALGGWQALDNQSLFDLEYWELEQAKLRKPGSAPEFEGKVVLVTGAASGIGRAVTDAFLERGACVVALDRHPDTPTLFASGNVKGVVCDVTSTAQLQRAVLEGVCEFGGIDVLVSNAGCFPESRRLESLDDAALAQSLSVNFTSHQALLRESLPYLKNGFEPSVIFVGSKNVPAPGPGAGAYSVAKAALAQLARVAALELGQYGIRVNTVHPNAVFDTGVWTDEVLRQRAQHYGMTVEQYRKNNLLQTEITSADVAMLVLAMAGRAFAKTTGAQVPLDGGNERVI